MVEDLPIITRNRIQKAVPNCDCAGRKYPKEEREDLVRYMLLAAEIQRDCDMNSCLWGQLCK